MDEKTSVRNLINL